MAMNELLLLDGAQIHLETSCDLLKQTFKRPLQQSPLCASFMDWVKIREPSIRPCGNENTDGNAMYNYALVLSTKRDNWSSGISWFAVRAVLGYNLALFHHWRGLNFGAESDLSAALYHYKLAWNSIQLMKDRVGMDHLALAVLNNTAHIHCQLMRFDHASVCVGVMRMMISTRIGSMPRLERMKGYDTFILNAMLPFLTCHLAPAA
jgi:hypothetical protein